MTRFTQSARALPVLFRDVTIDGQAYVVQSSPQDDGSTQFSAWQPTTFIDSPFQTVSSLGLERGCFGLVGTDADRALYGHLPIGEERFAAVTSAFKIAAIRARRVILAAFPELHQHGISRGDMDYQLLRHPVLA